MSELRLAELLAALSFATDLGIGHPMEQSLRTCLLALRLADELGVPAETRSDVYYVALLRSVGCTADAASEAEFSDGDDVAWRAGMVRTETASPKESFRFALSHAGKGRPPLRRGRAVIQMLVRGTRYEYAAITAFCEVAQSVAARCGLRAQVQIALGHSFERWDGSGIPDRVSGESIALPARVVRVARHAAMYHRSAGAAAALRMVRERSGGAYDPAVADAFARRGKELLAELDAGSVWDVVLGCEPTPQPWIPASRLDDVARAFADFVDLKSPFLYGHSTEVGELAESAARLLGISPDGAVSVRHAGYLHDLGRTSVPNGIWDKPAPLNRSEWERVRLHPYYTERILATSGALRPLAEMASMHHERLDGSGYHRGAVGAAQSVEAQLLAAADTFAAMTQARPHRPAQSKSAAADVLRADVRAGRLDGDPCRAVLEAAGQPARMRAVHPAGLSEREVEVLRLLSEGWSNRRIAASLVISPETVNHHVRHIYAKTGVTTRAAAALYAMEHRLLRR